MVLVCWQLVITLNSLSPVFYAGLKTLTNPTGFKASH